jgi:hypothetical protein
MPASAAVTVNLDVEVSAASALHVFKDATSHTYNTIVPSVSLAASTLNNLIEFWEPSSDSKEIESHLDLTSYKTSALSLYSGLKSVLASSFECKDAEPYKTDAGANIGDYAALAGFGKVALGQAAKAVFGHVAATAAITNDADYALNMLKETEVSTSWEMINTNGGNQTAAVPNLANALVRDLVKKGYNGEAEIKDYVNASELTSIVKQVIGQDPSRAKDQDNNQLAPNTRQKLVFYPLDTVYMSINVSFPSIYLSTATATAVAPAGLGVSGGSNASKKFDIKMVLT